MPNDSVEHKDCSHTPEPKMSDNNTSIFIHNCDQKLFQAATIASSHSENLYQICNLSRKELGQTGDGHFSPVGGLS